MSVASFWRPFFAKQCLTFASQKSMASMVASGPELCFMLDIGNRRKQKQTFIFKHQRHLNKPIDSYRRNFAFLLKMLKCQLKYPLDDLEHKMQPKLFAMAVSHSENHDAAGVNRHTQKNGEKEPHHTKKRKRAWKRKREKECERDRPRRQEYGEWNVRVNVDIELYFKCCFVSQR